ncbi:hypothetical protein BU15DRAFT_78984 [Melanogaster broomeanus]|nr:hypothetical protein BU15DRAFT_78984 [Melanogaster broomeanus]
MSVSSNARKPASFQSLPLDILLEIFDLSPLSCLLDDSISLNHIQMDDHRHARELDDVRLSRHSPHLRLRTFCKSLRDAVDEYQPFWQSLSIDWTERSALEISELWFRNCRIGDIYLSVVPYKYYTKKHAQLVPPPPAPALLDCLQRHASLISSAIFHLPDGIDYLLPLAQALQPHVERMQYHAPRPLQAPVEPIGGEEDKEEDTPLLARMLHRLRLPVSSKVWVEPIDPSFREVPLLIRWELLSDLVLLHGSDYVTSSTISSSAAPEWTINREHEIRIPTLTSLTLVLNFGGYDEADTPEDGQQRALDFIATFRCPALQDFALYSDIVGTCQGPMREAMEVGRVLCLGETDDSLPLRRLKVDANFGPADFLSLLDRAVDLECLHVTFYDRRVFEHVLHALIWDSDTRRCPNLREICLVTDGTECSVDTMMELAPLSQEVALSRLGESCVMHDYQGLPVS